MNYRNYTDEEFRRLLQTDPDNLELVYEASDRFLKDNNEIETVFEVLVSCPECDHSWEETVDTADLV